MPTYLMAGFAIAGAVAAAGPLIIHLLNRRRYRVVEWAAMDFLREAMKRNRRMMQLRDWLLLAVRTAVVLLFGLAMARPFFGRSGGAGTQADPVHAVLIVDNSMSMGYRQSRTPGAGEGGAGLVLDDVKAKAREFVESLPDGSQISVVPLCGGAERVSRDVYKTKEAALEALESVQPIDRRGQALAAAQLAVDACKLAPALPAKRVVFLGDQQAAGWPTESLAKAYPELPEMQVVSLAPSTASNAWVSKFGIADGVADTQTDSHFTATVRYQGPARRTGVRVALRVGDETVSVQTVDLDPDQSREIQFPPYRFADVEPDQGKPAFVPAAVAIDDYEWDGLPADNEKFAVIPVVAALPVVFVDQHGDQENPRKNEYGETFHLRRLLSPQTSRSDLRRQLVQVIHRRLTEIEELARLSPEDLLDPRRNFLRDARLVVVAGVESPSEEAALVLRKYVEQGGQLLVAAGGEFEPAAWNAIAWQDGGGLLPAPLGAGLVDVQEELAGGGRDVKPFELEFDSLTHDFFQFPGTPRELIEDVYHEPVFFRAVRAELTPAASQAAVDAERKRIEDDRAFLRQAREREAAFAAKETQGTLSQEDEQARTALRSDIARRAPDWLRLSPDQEDLSEIDAAELAERSRPHVLGEFGRVIQVEGEKRNLPFLLERHLGRGRLLFCTTGVFSEDWNSLTRTSAIMLFDRVCRMLIEASLPRRAFDPADQLRVPLESADRLARYTLQRPDEEAGEDLPLSALGPTSQGFVIRDAVRRGVYRVQAWPAAESTDAGLRMNALWSLPLAVTGADREESELAWLDKEEFQQRIGPQDQVKFSWVAANEPIRLDGPGASGRDLWWWFMLLVLLGVLTEMAILAWPQLKRA